MNTKFLLGQHLILVPFECEEVLPPDHDIQFLTPYISYIRELTKKMHIPINTKRLNGGIKGRPGREKARGGESMRQCNNFKIRNHMTGNATATLNDIFSQTKTVIHLQFNNKATVKQAKNIVCYTMPLESKGKRIHYITINNQAQQKSNGNHQFLRLAITWCWVFNEMFTDVQVVKNITCIYGNQRFIIIIVLKADNGP